MAGAVHPAASIAKPRLLFFYVSSDGQARRAEGFLAQVLQRRRNHDTFVVHRIDAAERADLARRLHIDETPTLVVVADQKIRARLARPRGCSEIQEFLQPWLH